MKIYILRITSAILLVLLMLSIFILSSETAEISKDTSNGFSYRLFCVIIPGFADKSEVEQNSIIKSASFFIRKAAHFSAYFAMGILSLLNFITYRRINLYLRLAIALSVCFLYSVSDEIHQLFVTGRSGEIRDVLIDSVGALLGVAVCIGLICIIRGKSKEKSMDSEIKGDFSA